MPSLDTPYRDKKVVGVFVRFFVRHFLQTMKTIYILIDDVIRHNLKVFFNIFDYEMCSYDQNQSGRSIGYRQ
jgi:hypothetical protein